MKKTETKTSLIVFDESERFLRVSSKPDTEIELADARFDFEEAAKLVDYKKLPVLADTSNVSNSSKEVRDFYASKEMAENISAMAVIVSSLSTRIVGNFFINTSKPHFPTKLFTNEAAAITWLKLVIERNDTVNTNSKKSMITSPPSQQS
jgi:hypothetical protein